MQVIEIEGIGGPEMLRLAERPDPTPGPGEVVVDIYAASVNAADWKVRRGSAILDPSFPHIPGRDFSGVVSAVGDGADLSVGDEVSASAPSAPKAPTRSGS